MAIVRNTITIEAPVENVFAYIADTTNLPEIWPSLVEVSDVEVLPSGGSKFRWKYKMAGVHFDGAGEATEFIENKRIVSESEGGVSSTITWMFEPEGGGTRVTNVADYTVHLPVLSKLAEPFLTRINANEGAAILANLKARMET